MWGGCTQLGLVEGWEMPGDKLEALYGNSTCPGSGASLLAQQRSSLPCPLAQPHSWEPSKAGAGSRACLLHSSYGLVSRHRQVLGLAGRL